jgi:O-antigen ligase
MKRRLKLPPVAWPLAFFLLAVLASVASSSLHPLEPYKGQEPMGRVLRALATLTIGLSFYTVSMLQTKADKGLRSSLRALYTGAFLALIWATVQAYFALERVPSLPDWFERWHRLFVIRDPPLGRVAGFAFEPSWFADQLAVLYLPLWYGSVLCRRSAFSRNASWRSIELLLSVWGTVLLLLTFSLVGYLDLFAMIGVLILTVLWEVSARATPRKEPSTARARGWMIWSLRSVMIGLGVAALIAAIGLVAGTVLSGYLNIGGRSSTQEAQADLARLGAAERIYSFANRLGIAERFVLWEAGYRCFELSPILGVGLGNSGFLFPRLMPSYGYSLEEIRQLMDPDNPTFPNPKNLWVRLLAETGIVGTSLFLIWLLLLGVGAVALLRSAPLPRRFMGIAGTLGLIALVLEGFSLDTFALPQMWVLTGFLSSSLPRYVRCGAVHPESTPMPLIRGNTKTS